MKILFLHGWHSVPGGVKPTHLQNHGHEVHNPHLDDDDFDAALKTAQLEFDNNHPDVVVGSSRGGAIAMNIHTSDARLILLCPAWKRWGTADSVKPGTVILHSRADDVVPFTDSEQLATNSGVTLFEVGHDHRLADPASLSAMLWACEMTGEQLDLPAVDETPFDDRKTTATLKEASYICDACGEEIVIPLDVSEGSRQTYVEDCPVCCRANTIHVDIDDSGTPKIRAEPEQDRT